ncbi:hypothetical protein GWK47_040576 [Chionoecetes opilio]|uniref:Uncharacterized protein n=1 Tax=Chionoecetes opilio TaxID=41210 RepID=A0A8J5CL45_CHIOP|nr:hypothetical protein GWK47_040576 [Chionoecetes opilio]
MWYVSEENADLPFSDARIDVERRSRWSRLGQARPREDLKRFGVKKMTMSSSLSVLRHFEDTVLLSETSSGRGLPAKKPGIVGVGRPIQGRSETGNLASDWSTMPRRRGIALGQPLPGVPEVAAQENLSPPISPPPHRKLVGR